MILPRFVPRSAAISAASSGFALAEKRTMSPSLGAQYVVGEENDVKPSIPVPVRTRPRERGEKVGFAEKDETVLLFVVHSLNTRAE